MAQRVVIAIALACSPRFIISDDATSGLDVTVQAQVLELIRSLVSERGTSMLFITRDVGITAHYCDRVASHLCRRDHGGRRPRGVLLRRSAAPLHACLLLAAFAHNARLRRYWLGETRPSEDSGAEPGRLLACQNRCARAQDRCRDDHPALLGTAAGHFVRCHFPVER